MTSLELNVDADTYRRLRQHLAGGEDGFEEAAFLFCTMNQELGVTKLTAADAWILPPEAFASRSEFYLELTDETRASLIKRAHDLASCLIEMHSHPNQAHAEFSWSDLRGFEEFVPHVRWRLKGRPYIAVVYGSNDFDALAWQGDSNTTSKLAAIVVNNKRLLPTGRTLSQIRKTA